MAKNEKPVDVQNDEFRGVGGSYIFDPKTGSRTRVAGQPLKPAAEVLVPAAEVPAQNDGDLK
jgi:hypothetical protein